MFGNMSIFEIIVGFFTIFGVIVGLLYVSKKLVIRKHKKSTIKQKMFGGKKNQQAGGDINNDK